MWVLGFLLFIGVAITIPGCSSESNLVNPVNDVLIKNNNGYHAPDTIKVTSPYATIDKMYQVLGVTQGITSIGGVHKIKDGVNLPFAEYKYYDSTECSTHDCIPFITMCNDSQFVFIDSLVGDAGSKSYQRHTYTLYSNDVIKDSVENLIFNKWELGGIDALIITISGYDTTVVIKDLFDNEVFGQLKKGTIDKTIDVLSPNGFFEGRIKILEFIKP
jgi:hypothetical protein